MARTLEEIRQKGLEALRKELGRADMIRFLQQFESGSGNYAQETRLGGWHVARRPSR